MLSVVDWDIGVQHMTVLSYMFWLTYKGAITQAVGYTGQIRHLLHMYSFPFVSC